MSEKINYVPIYQKVTLTIKEASEYSNIGINKIDAMLREPNCPFVLFVGVKKLVKRKEFEGFISKALLKRKRQCDILYMLHWLFFSFEKGVNNWVKI